MFSLAGFEEVLGATCHEADELRRCLKDVQDQREALLMAALSVFHVVRAEEPLLTDRLRALPGHIQDTVSLGARYGAATALALVQLRSGLHLGEFEPVFPETASATTRQVDVDDILQNSTDPGLDGL